MPRPWMSELRRNPKILLILSICGRLLIMLLQDHGNVAANRKCPTICKAECRETKISSQTFGTQTSKSPPAQPQPPSRCEGGIRNGPSRARESSSAAQLVRISLTSASLAGEAPASFAEERVQREVFGTEPLGRGAFEALLRKHPACLCQCRRHRRRRGVGMRLQEGCMDKVSCGRSPGLLGCSRLYKDATERPDIGLQR
mmetsp:Transcript_94005/g.236889  ORF Transcript_94005/g.236889 Transcript_94005/m.236889 type:complete len:200 (-) Transcript_94005:783-1382(-)